MDDIKKAVVGWFERLRDLNENELFVANGHDLIDWLQEEYGADLINRISKVCDKRAENLGEPV